MRSPRRTSGLPSVLRTPPVLFALIFFAIFLLHISLLQLPYFWDEAGYYVPAARDMLFGASLIPHSTLSNAHPPLVLAWLALCWKVVGFTPAVTRTAMLALAAFSLLGVFRLAERVANTHVAIGATACMALYSVFFAQSSLAQVDLAAAGLTFWALSAYLEGELAATTIWFSLAALAKETAIITPLAVAAWEFLGWLLHRTSFHYFWNNDEKETRGVVHNGLAIRITGLAIPVLPLALWYTYHYLRTGFVFGNPEFFRYNVAATLNLTRFALALALRLWQVFGYMHLWILTLAMLLSMLLPPGRDSSGERPRIAIPVQMIFFAVVFAYVVVMALIGGALLARYILPAIPLVVILAVSTLWRRLRWWRVAVGFVSATFVLAWFWNPPYGFSPEDNLAYRDYILLHQEAETFLEARYPMAHVLTAWPASDEITRPWLGYITRPMRVLRIEDFSLDNILSAADVRSKYEVALVFSTKYEPRPMWWDHWGKWNELKTRFFGFHRDLPPAAVAGILGGHIVFSEERRGQWIALIEIEKNEIQEADQPGDYSSAE